MPMRSTATTIDEYIAEHPPEVQRVLQEMRARIHEWAPEATESISYAIPTFDLNGHLVHFAAFKDHVSFFPTGSGVEAFKDELEPYKGGKGTVQFPLQEPIPWDLVRRIVEYRVQQNAAKAPKRSAKAKKG
jgi:uncharacterized protein YdhG (YjbR/CyaY superfamily)